MPEKCIAITDRHTRCKIDAAEGSEFCKRHGPPPPANDALTRNMNAAMNRQTSIYQINFDSVTEAALDDILADILADLADVFDLAGKYDGPGGIPLSGEIAGSGVSVDTWHTPYVRIRVSGDDVARAVAKEITSNADLEFSIRTGVGVHQRWLD